VPGRPVCRAIVLVFAGVYLFAVAVLAIGMFGQEPDPLAAIPVVLLGMPWNRLVDLTPERWWPWLAAMAPLLNLLLIAGACRGLRRLIA
jgi:hypothetical protein